MKKKKKKKKKKPLTVITRATEKGRNEGKLKNLGKKVTVTTNNRIQAGFNSARRCRKLSFSTSQRVKRKICVQKENKTIK